MTVVIRGSCGTQCYGRIVASIVTGGPVIDVAELLDNLVGQERCNAVSRKNAEVQDVLKQNFVTYDEGRIRCPWRAEVEDAMQDKRSWTYQGVE